MFSALISARAGLTDEDLLIALVAERKTYEGVVRRAAIPLDDPDRHLESDPSLSRNFELLAEARARSVALPWDVASPT